MGVLYNMCVVLALCLFTITGVVLGKGVEVQLNMVKETREKTQYPVQLFPEISNRNAWDKVKTEKEFVASWPDIIKKADKILGSPIPVLRASKYMEFRQSGNRNHFEHDYFSRRGDLSILFLAEACCYNGRYVARIVDEIWAILNEPTWCLPAHTEIVDPLPDFTEEHIDLFSAETSAQLSLVLAGMEKELTAVSPNLVRRMRRVLLERAVMPIKQHEETFWWQRGMNNWTPWICSNLLVSGAVLLEKEKLVAFINSLQSSIDFYFEHYKEDGCSEEGPMYWHQSPLKMFLYLETLYRLRLPSSEDYFKNEKFCRMGEYIANVWIGKNYYTPFADSNVKQQTSLSRLLQLYAVRIQSKKLASYAKRIPVFTNSGLAYTRGALFPALANLFWHENAENQNLSDKMIDFWKWYAKTQVLFARHNRLYLGAKAGTNGEGHNHNDVGQFVIAVDCVPLIIDLGRGEYTRDTFSKKRYEKFQLNSFGHNAMIFNHCGQSAGGDFGARDVQCTNKDGIITFVMELSGAYPDTIGLSFYRRQISFDTEQDKISISDCWEGKEKLQPALFLYSPEKVEDGVFNAVLKMTASADYQCKFLKLTDSVLCKNWGDGVWKSSFSFPKAKKGCLNLTFELLPKNL